MPNTVGAMLWVARSSADLAGVTGTENIELHMEKVLLNTAFQYGNFFGEILRPIHQVTSDADKMGLLGSSKGTSNERVYDRQHDIWQAVRLRRVSYGFSGPR